MDEYQKLIDEVNAEIREWQSRRLACQGTNVIPPTYVTSRLYSLLGVPLEKWAEAKARVQARFEAVGWKVSWGGGLMILSPATK